MSQKAVTMDARPSVLSTGLALFSMFFGAGNIIFPLIVGKMSGNEIPYAILGLGFSAVAFPFLGLIAMMFYGGSLSAFLGRLGRWPAIVILFALQMSQGPVGSMPRLITLMHASVKCYLPLSLVSFSVLICALVFVWTLRPQKIVRLLGNYLTPLLLLTLAMIVIVGSIGAPSPEIVNEGSFHYFGQGLKMGYQTMDLTAALLFAGLVLPHLSRGTNDPKEVQKRMIQASLIASGLLMITYIGLCWIASHHTFSDAAPEELLQRIASRALGPFGALVSAIAVLLACLTTAISLAAVFTKYLKEEIFKNRFKEKTVLAITLGATALFANLGFSGIMKLWGPILEVLYPSLIVLCLMNIAHHLYQVKPIRAPVFIVLAIALGGYCFG